MGIRVARIPAFAAVDWIISFAATRASLRIVRSQHSSFSRKVATVRQFSGEWVILLFPKDFCSSLFNAKQGGQAPFSMSNREDKTRSEMYVHGKDGR